LKQAPASEVAHTLGFGGAALGLHAPFITLSKLEDMTDAVSDDAVE
jgi:hypothetical protein